MGVPSQANLAFPNSGVAEPLTTVLRKRRSLEAYGGLSPIGLREEHKSGTSGLLSGASILEIPHHRGAQAVITGGLSEFGETFSVTARVLDMAPPGTGCSCYM
ncbi:MAG: hypothetical protein ONB30_10845 [candidate division KSB1 bacterium]|nr:hypothetical protein [candidate division KSB1 bacterium]